MQIEDGKPFVNRGILLKCLDQRILTSQLFFQLRVFSLQARLFGQQFAVVLDHGKEKNRRKQQEGADGEGNKHQPMPQGRCRGGGNGL
ncbi:MAG: hypothetical protein IPK83_22755 [Planctomycetes bacterium]|nr:hypothetical protein [Planctomycetota bacterium]